MSTETFREPLPGAVDPYSLGRRYDAAGRGGRSFATGHGEGGPASKRVVVGYGFRNPPDVARRSHQYGIGEPDIDFAR